MTKEYSLKDLASIVDVPMEVARAMGKFAILNQALAQKGLGNVVHRCEDGRMAGQYTGDAEKDLEGLSEVPKK